MILSYYILVSYLRINLIYEQGAWNEISSTTKLALDKCVDNGGLPARRVHCARGITNDIKRTITSRTITICTVTICTFTIHNNGR